MTDRVLEVLKKYNAAFCIYELAGYHSPIELTTDWTYIRLHAPHTGWASAGPCTRKQIIQKD